MSAKNIWPKNELICKPLDNLDDIESFLKNPPPWKSLCTDLKRHSKYSIRNVDINSNYGEISVESPQAFCHIDSDAEIFRYKEEKLPKTLVCHDMANGYHDDSLVDGTGNHDAYTFYNWAGINIFCYFSHHFITIPPLGWINVGHAHGVKVIGTVITEWTDGANIWDKLLDDEALWKNFASSLVIIAKMLKFDGWLLNIENNILKPNVLLEFVSYFHKILHEELNDPVLIWYDSVTTEGHLKWQNGLTDKNKPFFDACDGLFTNYSWNVEDIQSGAELAGDRLTDLYIGIDVWGRNFFGGGQFNTLKAIKVAHERGCSLAIFAQAWTHEAVTDQDIYEGMDKYDVFLLRDRALWGTIWPCLNTKLPFALPFQTSFCRGQGKKRRLHGEVICPVPWYNLRHMQYQPNSSHGPHGYLLSTLDEIFKVSLPHEKKGILNIVNTKESENMLLEPKVDLETESTFSKVDETTQETNTTGEQLVESSRTVKRKMAVAFRHNFKAQKASVAQSVAAAEDNDMSQNSVEKPPSTIEVSVNLNVGKTDKTRYSLARIDTESECLEFYMDDSFIGGSCIKVNPPQEQNSDIRCMRLFHCDFYCEDALIVCIVTKTLMGYEGQYLNVKLFATDGDNDFKAVLIGRRAQRLAPQCQSSNGVCIVNPLCSPSDPAFRELQKFILLNEPGFYVPVENCYDWSVRYYEVRMPGKRVTSINCVPGLADGPLLLGYIGLCSKLSGTRSNDRRASGKKSH